MTFLLTEWVASLNLNTLCTIIAILMHYALLSSFSWMFVEAIHLYLLMVRVFNTYIKKYITKLSAFAWGIPAIIVGIVASVRQDYYGPTPIKIGNSSYTNNIFAKDPLKTRSFCKDCSTVLILTCLLGTTWGLAYLGYGLYTLPVLYLFTIFNSFQGGMVSIYLNKLGPNPDLDIISMESAHHPQPKEVNVGCTCGSFLNEFGFVHECPVMD
ncbi:AGRG6 protein, partial [Polypterus senegalus]